MAWRRAVRRISTWASHIEELGLIVGPGNIRVGDEATQFTTDWTRHYASTRDDQQAVVLPSSTREVQQIMEYINKFPSELSGIPQGGNTGLVGGGVGVRGSKRGEVIIALQRMNRIISVDPSDSTLVCESGCVLEALNHSLESKYNLTMPIGSLKSSDLYWVLCAQKLLKHRENREEAYG
jgi:FAD/FMN-containing dehydrogenase